ncbi:MAG: radical SAM protein [Desulfofustis sp.]|nr:radical SAM protein [Desulfofustis sp.]
MKPVSSGLWQSGHLSERADRAVAALGHCQLCPRRCRVNRLNNEHGFCTTGRHARVASYGPHHGEEQPLTGSRGSGTIFFASCNLRCSFCQNYEISHDRGDSVEVDRFDLAAVMLDLQQQGCHNINVVTPSHVLPQLLEALPIALAAGLQIPLVYNCSGYDASEALTLLDGVVDIYLPDFKFWQVASAQRFLQAPDYPEVARQALTLMHRQVGDLQIDDRGLAVRGLLVRHLLMPGGLPETAAILSFIAKEIGTATYINIMDQYHPCGTAADDPILAAHPAADQYAQAIELAGQAGLHRLDRRDIGSLLRRLGIT